MEKTPTIPAEVTVDQLPPANELTSEQRLLLVNKFRAKTKAGEKLKPEESAYAIDLLRAGRAVASATTKSKTKKAPAPAVTLDDF